MSCSFPQRTIALVVLAAAALLPASGAKAASLSLSATRDARFPERAFVLTLPEHDELAAGQVQALENDAPVRGLRVAPIGASQRSKLGVALAIDASSSMRGRAYAGAFAAAGAFARERDQRQPFALLTFNGGSRVALPFTSDAESIRTALSSPGTPEGGTQLYDAALQAIGMVRHANLPGGFVVVLSDGSDHGSTASTAEVAAAARAANVRIYTVGLRSEHFDPAALRQLAGSAGGTYSEATSPGDLHEIYRALGAQFSNQHLLTYRSLANPGHEVTLRVAVEGIGMATTSYRSPKLTIAGSDAASASGWDSPFALLAAVLTVACLIALAVIILLKSGRLTPRERVNEFVRTPVEDEADSPSLTGRLAAGAERSLAKAGWWESFVTELDVGGFSQRPGLILLEVAFAALSVAILATAVAGTALVGLVCLLFAPVVARAVVRGRARRERCRFADQLADHLAVVGGSLRAGHSLSGALTSALDEAPEPSRREFARVINDERLGKPLEDALEDMAKRMKNREIEHVALLAKLQREAGADAAEMIEQVVATVRERQELRRAVQTLTAQGRFSQLILSILPAVSLLFLTLTYQDYVDPLYHTPGGHLVLAIAATLVVAGSLVIRRIVSFKV